MSFFSLKSQYQPTGDQPQAISKLVKGLRSGYTDQTLLGVTGSGKTFTMANIIAKVQKPTLVISHNKTLAAQLYQEFRDFFPDNKVGYFVSYYDFYQPEAYLPASGTYIEKEAQINELIDQLRLEATENILSGSDTLIVSSVSCIYNLGHPQNYQKNTYSLKIGQKINVRDFCLRLVKLQYRQNQFDFKRGTFRERGEHVDIYLSTQDLALRVKVEQAQVIELRLINPLTAKTEKTVDSLTIYPAKHYLVASQKLNRAYQQIKADLEKEVLSFTKQKKLVEAQRLNQRVNHDLEMIKELGYVNGIENYSRYFDGRSIGDPPFSLLEYFQYRYQNNWLLFIDESHMTIPQLNGMHNGDYARKKSLVEHGFRLKAAYDNRPLKFAELMSKKPPTIYFSATPSSWEIKQSKQVVEQLIRPTGIADPIVSLRPVKDQISDLVKEIGKVTKKKQRVLVTTLTKKIAEDLSFFLKDRGIKAHYLHSDVKTLQRSDILDKLRQGRYEVLIGINLLREGLDLPEVTLVAILDADREGFLRSRTALVQTMGRAARNSEGKVIIYTDKMTHSIAEAIKEVKRRRFAQLLYNKKHHINPKTIIKPIRSRLIAAQETDLKFYSIHSKVGTNALEAIKKDNLTAFDQKKIVSQLKRQMKSAAESLDFEFAAKLRDKIKELEN